MNLPSLELSSEFEIGQKIWHRVSKDEGVIVGVSEWDGQWYVWWDSLKQTTSTPQHLIQSWKGEWISASQLEPWSEGIEGAV